MSQKKPIIDIIKTNVPKALNLLNKNKEILTLLGTAGLKANNSIQNYKLKKEDSKKIKTNPIESRFLSFKNEILPNINTYSYIELKGFTDEIKRYIKHLEVEQIKNPINRQIKLARIKKWQDNLNAIEITLMNKSYQEFLKIYNSPEYKSTFFEKKIVNDFKEISTKEELFNFIHRYTDSDISNDFN